MSDTNLYYDKVICYHYNHYRLSWQAFTDDNSPTNIQVETSVSIYRDNPIALFSIVYTNGLTNASIPNTSNQALSTFPSFVIEDMDMKRGYLTWSGGRKFYSYLCLCM